MAILIIPVLSFGCHIFGGSLANRFILRRVTKAVSVIENLPLYEKVLEEIEMFILKEKI